MNAQAPNRVRSEIVAFTRLARTQSRLSVQYRHWSAQAAEEGKTALADRWRAESRRLRIEASWHISMAMRRADA
jgi:hypothetical protein